MFCLFVFLIALLINIYTSILMTATKVKKNIKWLVLIEIIKNDLYNCWYLNFSKMYNKIHRKCQKVFKISFQELVESLWKENFVWKPVWWKDFLKNVSVFKTKNISKFNLKFKYITKTKFILCIMYFAPFCNAFYWILSAISIRNCVLCEINVCS